MNELTDNSHKKPWLTPEQQVAHLKAKGVRFAYMSEAEAAAYLKRSNNYFRLRAYRTGFSKVDAGPRKGQYARLDFGMLADLAAIDTRLRYEMLQMALDIEHFAKVKLLDRLEQEGEDGYAVVEDFIASFSAAATPGRASNALLDTIIRGKASPYTCDILAKWPDHDYPVWAFLEIVSFGTFNHFYKFCAERFDSKAMLNEFYLLQTVKSLRNACAHNNCILNDLQSGKPMYAPRAAVSIAVSEIEGIGVKQRKAKLRNDRLQQITTALYTYRELAPETSITQRAKSLRKLMKRATRHIDYYEGNHQVLTAFEFLAKIIAAWYPRDAKPRAKNTLVQNTTNM